MNNLALVAKSSVSVGLGRWESILFAFGLLLVAGLLGESFFAEKTKWYKLAEALVVVGVLGELVADGRIFSLTAQLEALTDLQVAELNRDAGDARLATGKAIERATAEEVEIDRLRAAAKEFEAKLASANTQARVAEARIADSERGIADANARAADAQKIAEAERLARFELATIVAPRGLNESEMNDVRQALEPFAGKSVAVVSYAFDLEAVTLGRQIIAVLMASGLKVRDVGPILPPTDPIVRGLHVGGPQSERVFVEALRSAFIAKSRIGMSAGELPIGIDTQGLEAVFLIGTKAFPPIAPANFVIK